MMDVEDIIGFFILLVILFSLGFVFFIEFNFIRGEVTYSEYIEINEHVLSYPELKTEVELYMKDNKLTYREYNMINKNRLKLKSELCQLELKSNLFRSVNIDEDK